VTKGAQGTQGITGEKGAQGTQGITGTKGAQGTQGITGEKGVQGTQGITGTKGAQGTQGITGEKGVQGTQGITGTKGAQGTNPTAPGSNNEMLTSDGAGGIVAEANFTFDGSTAYLDGNLQIEQQTLTDASTVTWNLNNGSNSKVTLGASRTLSITNANTGDTGVILVQQGTGTTYNLTLPATSVIIGGGTYTTTTTSNGIDVLGVYYDGSNYYWSIPNGATGEKGAQGTTGTGTKGAQGTQGITGTKGAQGTQGITGEKGLQGTQGITGEKGSRHTRYKAHKV
jgi:collagen type I alpha